MLIESSISRSSTASRTLLSYQHRRSRPRIPLDHGDVVDAQQRRGIETKSDIVIRDRTDSLAIGDRCVCGCRKIDEESFVRLDERVAVDCDAESSGGDAHPERERRRSRSVVAVRRRCCAVAGRVVHRHWNARQSRETDREGQRRGASSSLRHRDIVNADRHTGLVIGVGHQDIARVQSAVGKIHAHGSRRDDRVGHIAVIQRVIDPADRHRLCKIPIAG